MLSTVIRLMIWTADTPRCGVQFLFQVLQIKNNRVILTSQENLGVGIVCVVSSKYCDCETFNCYSSNCNVWFS